MFKKWQAKAAAVLVFLTPIKWAVEQFGWWQTLSQIPFIPILLGRWFPPGAFIVGTLLGGWAYWDTTIRKEQAGFAFNSAKRNRITRNTLAVVLGVILIMVVLPLSYKLFHRKALPPSAAFPKPPDEVTLSAILTEWSSDASGKIHAVVKIDHKVPEGFPYYLLVISRAVDNTVYEMEDTQIEKSAPFAVSDQNIELTMSQRFMTRALELKRVNLFLVILPDSIGVNQISKISDVARFGGKTGPVYEFKPTRKIAERKRSVSSRSSTKIVDNQGDIRDTQIGTVKVDPKFSPESNITVIQNAKGSHMDSLKIGGVYLGATWTRDIPPPPEGSPESVSKATVAQLISDIREWQDGRELTGEKVKEFHERFGKRILLVSEVLRNCEQQNPIIELYNRETYPDNLPQIVPLQLESLQLINEDSEGKRCTDN